MDHVSEFPPSAQYFFSEMESTSNCWSWAHEEEVGCGMVSHDNHLLILGGYGYPSGPTQPGAEFIKDSRHTDGVGWTNEVHSYDLKEGEGV